MNKGTAKYIAMGAMFSQMLENGPNIRNKPDPSSRVREETCPGCGDTHESNKHLYCSKECNPHVD